MKLAIFALTQNAADLAAEIALKNGGDLFSKRQPQGNADLSIQLIDGNFKSLVKQAFNDYQALIFVMATGIVIRTIAPLIVSKDSDPAVVVMDEKGNNVISLLSGHLGGANQLTKLVANQLGANPVITTATDVNGVIAFDNFAKNNDLIIDDIATIKFISDKMIHSEKIELYSDVKIAQPLPDNLVLIKDFEHYTKNNSGVIITYKNNLSQQVSNSLLLIAPHLVLGFGCRRGKSKEEIGKAIDEFLAEHQIDKRAIAKLATIEVKADEEGLLAYCQENNLPLDIFRIDEVADIETYFEGSEFVKHTLGIKAVSEPCAYLSAGKQAKKLVGKTKCGGITLALYQQAIELVISE